MSVVTPSITVGTLLASAGRGGFVVTLVAGASGLERQITTPMSQKIGLALAGYDAYLRPGRALVFGESEIRFLGSLDAPAARDAVVRVLRHDIPCILVTSDLDVPPELAQESDAAGLPVLRTPLPTPVAIARLSAFLDDLLAPRELLHGVLLDVLGLGLLIVGESGIGKSECALDLVVRGHRLVADDTVEVRRRAQTVVIGTCPELTRHHMEIRGIGVINVRDMFGVASTRHSKRVEFVVVLERWDPARDYERLGIDEHVYDLLGVPIPMVRMPVGPGRNVAILVEVAARNQLLRARGEHAARRLVERADRALLGADAADPLACSGEADDLEDDR
jgi:HPr kinase/phosphorylase